MLEKETFQENLRELVDEFLEKEEHKKVKELILSLNSEGNEYTANLLFDYACKESATFKNSAVQKDKKS